MPIEQVTTSAETKSHALAAWLLCSATWLGAFLLFFVEPLIARFILPWFGGSAGVWATCLVFFQVCLLGGYAYAHGLVRYAGPRVQVMVQAVLLLGALLALPIVPGPQWKPSPTAEPISHILLLLAGCLGVPFLALSATGPLIQVWFTELCPGRTPYRLYALSNAGSLLALLCYPFVFEPVLTRRAQAHAWGCGLGLFALIQGSILALRWRQADSRSSRPREGRSAAPSGMPTAWTRGLWIILPACASWMLMAVTNKLSQDVAAIPFIWVLPLSLYLLSFILCFDNPLWYPRPIAHAALVIVLPLLGGFLWGVNSIPWVIQLGGYSAGLLLICMVCHGELYRLRPPPDRLTDFYLTLAAGGALGGLAVAVGAPHLFRDNLELNLGLGGVGLLVAAIHWRERTRVHLEGRDLRLWPGGLVGAVLLTAALICQYEVARRKTVVTERSFYGVLRLEELFKDDPIEHRFRLTSGDTLHGSQFADPSRSTTPTLYYSETSGVGQAIRRLRGSKPLHVGLIGLGVGTLAAYGQPGDRFRFYEINPQVLELARTRFSYLAQSKAKVEVVLGDARLSLEGEPAQGYDLLVVDAFTSDSIPVHLLTQEAFALYARHLAPKGVLAVHVSNRHLNLHPVVEGQARRLGWSWALVTDRLPRNLGAVPQSEWMILVSAPDTFERGAFRLVSTDPAVPAPRLWTDDYVSVFRLFKSLTPRLRD